MNRIFEISINKYGQNIISIEQLTEEFKSFDVINKRAILNQLLYLIMQSKPANEDIELSILNSKLKPTYTPCILLQKGVANYNLEKIISLPDFELEKVFVLLLNLFKIAYHRRYSVERNDSNKWWYWDLSDNTNIQTIKKMFLINSTEI